MHSVDIPEIYYELLLCTTPACSCTFFWSTMVPENSQFLSVHTCLLETLLWLWLKYKVELQPYYYWWINVHSIKNNCTMLPQLYQLSSKSKVPKMLHCQPPCDRRPFSPGWHLSIKDYKGSERALIFFKGHPGESTRLAGTTRYTAVRVNNCLKRFKIKVVSLVWPDYLFLWGGTYWLEIISAPSEKGLVDFHRPFCVGELQGFRYS